MQWSKTTEFACQLYLSFIADAFLLIVCTACQCNSHSTTCEFSSEEYERSGNMSGGVCQNCDENTAGAHCQYCSNGYFRTLDMPPSSPENPCQGNMRILSYWTTSLSSSISLLYLSSGFLRSRHVYVCAHAVMHATVQSHEAGCQQV